MSNAKIIIIIIIKDHSSKEKKEPWSGVPLPPPF
jgi:hypothetical protein